MTTLRPTLDATVARVLSRVPQAEAVFVRRSMSCVGCVMSPFETVREVAEVYGQDAAALAEELAGAVAAREGATRRSPTKGEWK